MLGVNMLSSSAQIVIHGTRVDTDNLVSSCRAASAMGLERIVAPIVGEVVNVTLESHIFKV